MAMKLAIALISLLFFENQSDNLILFICVNQCNCTALYKPSPPQLIIADISTKLNEEKKAFGSNQAA